jgi:hypothetical protein
MSETLPPLSEPAAHMYPSDLERFQSDETFAHAYSVAVGSPDERSVPLFTLSDMVKYADERAAAALAQREPLTDEQIVCLWEASTGHKMPNMGSSQWQLLAVARAIERSHGITKEQP